MKEILITTSPTFILFDPVETFKRDMFDIYTLQNYEPLANSLLKKYHHCLEKKIQDVLFWELILILR